VDSLPPSSIHYKLAITTHPKVRARIGFFDSLNVLLPGGATNTGMIPDSFPESRRKGLIDPNVVGPPAVYLASDDAQEISGKRIVAIEWRERNP